MAERDTPRNRITVEFASGSYFLGQTSPVEIRDSRLNLVRELRRGQSTELDDGLYEVSAVLEDGQKHSRLIQLHGGSRETVTLGPPPSATPAARAAALRHPTAAAGRDLFTPGLPTAMPDVDALTSPQARGPAAATLPLSGITTHGATLRESRTTEEGLDCWVFEPAPGLDSVPRADFRYGDSVITLSLPLNPLSGFPLNACEVIATPADKLPTLSAWISPERTVASTMQHMLASGYLLQAARIAEEAVELLRDKYEDPTGALLGALMLQKIDQLRLRLGWVRNLARDFDWLHDGKVLLALLLAREEAHRDEALALALRASGQAMLFTESYSLLLNLLRRWPWPNGAPEREQALASLAETAAYTDWDSITFCQVHSDEA